MCHPNNSVFMDIFSSFFLGLIYLLVWKDIQFSSYFCNYKYLFIKKIISAFYQLFSFSFSLFHIKVPLQTKHCFFFTFRPFFPNGFFIYLFLIYMLYYFAFLSMHYLCITLCTLITFNLGSSSYNSIHPSCNVGKFFMILFPL